jgi:hypothetical protein
MGEETLEAFSQRNQFDFWPAASKEVQSVPQAVLGGMPWGTM